ncbi:HlyD family efflux transporter periplasmic adaptor subunit [Sabulicella glaciei]|uniref:HlyD family efflux transporter periplasmic adaptor subunit n=1 Tax=Sabulicella glaciei TaxID=2984948 RepID=A0ABT3NZJ2_9PROT|nr:HlyD family efflux transporter periplasmic adaptor subunit [Roseococcus sp. MDT2-1-1]MCW8087353.1 HlyD family efflux transporter periplasmic adaptor subunit [Roseococcus sp. MDT2-1-1]
MRIGRDVAISRARMNQPVDPPAPQRALFRSEALAFQRDRRQWGEVALLQPVSTSILVWGALAALVLIIAFLFIAPYARKETVAGYLAPTTGTARIHALQSGIVSAVHVEEGQLVREGQPLLSVTTPQVSADGRDVNAAVLDALNRQRDVLARQIAAEGERDLSERARLTALIRGSETETTHIEGQVTTQRERIRLAEEFVAAATRLNPRGYVSDLDLRRREENLFEQRQNLDALRLQLAARRNQITEQRFTLEQLPIAVADRIRILEGELSATDQRIAEIGGRRAYEIRAPIAGRVSTLQATVGRPADPRQLQLTIVPEGSLLQAELFVPTRAAGFVRQGQRVRILYDAFPYQNFGTYGGRVIRISHTVLTSADITVPVQLDEPVYRVTVELERPDVDAYGNRIPLQPDMLLRADIILDSRTLVSWLVNPLLGAGARALQP